MEALGIGLAAAIGVTLGLLGGGGSILTVPVLVYALGFEAKEAIAASLAVVGATSLLGAIGHWRLGNVRLPTAGVFGVFAMAGTYLGARLSVFFSGGAQLILFALVMFVAAYFMFRGAPLGLRGVERRELRGTPGLPIALIAAEGIAVGVLTGLVGVGGGFLIVPALVLLGGLSMKEAVGTSLLVITMKSAAGLYGYLGQVELDWRFVGGFTLAAMVGIVLGTRLVTLVSQARLQKAFAILLLLMGTWLLYQNRNVIIAGQVSPATSFAGVAVDR